MKKEKFFTLACCLILGAACSGEAVCDTTGTAASRQGKACEVPEQLRDVHRIVFLGDSITQAGDYVVDIECWMASLGLPVEVINLGLGSETASDLTEAENEGHVKTFGFGRPPLSERLARVLDATKPDLLFACYGMNDGGSLPGDAGGLKRYTDAIAFLRETALKSGVRRVVLCTPPVHDAKGDAPASGPDASLARYSEWILSKRAEGWDVVDIHGPMREALDEGRAKDPSFFLAADGVHPGREGHWLMAQSILTQFFGVHLKDVRSAEDFFEGNGKEIRELVHQRMDLLFRAWMGRIGHTRPGVSGGPDAPSGLSLEEANAKAAEITRAMAAKVPSANQDPAR